MARMLLIENETDHTTYATIRNDKSLVVKKRYLDESGRLLAQERVVISAKGAESLTKLLNIEYRLNASQPVHYIGKGE